MDEPATSVSESLAVALEKATHALPTAHRAGPQNGEIVNDEYESFIRFQDWEFTQGFALTSRRKYQT